MVVLVAHRCKWISCAPSLLDVQAQGNDPVNTAVVMVTSVRCPRVLATYMDKVINRRDVSTYLSWLCNSDLFDCFLVKIGHVRWKLCTPKLDKAYIEEMDAIPIK